MLFTCKGAQDCDRARIKLSAQKSLDNVKSRRTSLRHIRKKFLDNTEDMEGVTPMKQVASKPLYCEKSMNENFTLDFLIFTI